jgi:formylmethanofuran dehydrogenase subunit A
MKKVLSLLAILGLAGFVVAPIYAQEEYVIDDGQIATDAGDVVDLEAEDVVAEDVAVEDDSLQQFMAENPEVVDDLNAGLDEFL